MDIHTLTPLKLHSHTCTHAYNYTYMHCASYADTDVEKCIARSDNEGWALICAGGEAEIGK